MVFYDVHCLATWWGITLKVCKRYTSNIIFTLKLYFVFPIGSHDIFFVFIYSTVSLWMHHSKAKGWNRGILQFSNITSRLDLYNFEDVKLWHKVGTTARPPNVWKRAEKLRQGRHSVAPPAQPSGKRVACVRRAQKLEEHVFETIFTLTKRRG